MFHEDPQHRFKRALVETLPPPKRDQTSTHENTFFACSAHEHGTLFFYFARFGNATTAQRVYFFFVKEAK